MNMRVKSRAFRDGMKRGLASPYELAFGGHWHPKTTPRDTVRESWELVGKQIDSALSEVSKKYGKIAQESDSKSSRKSCSRGKD